IQAVDAEIIDRMRFHLDFCPIYIADLVDDACHRVEGRTHYLPALASHPAVESRQIRRKLQSKRASPSCGRSQPAGPVEAVVEIAEDAAEPEQGHGVAPGPFELRHVAEVHAVESG